MKFGNIWGGGNIKKQKQSNFDLLSAPEFRRESTLAKTPANESTRVQLDSRKTVICSTQTEYRRIQRLLQTPPRKIQMDSRSSLWNSTPADIRMEEVVNERGGGLGFGLDRYAFGASKPLPILTIKVPIFRYATGASKPLPILAIKVPIFTYLSQNVSPFFTIFRCWHGANLKVLIILEKRTHIFLLKMGPMFRDFLWKGNLLEWHSMSYEYPRGVKCI